MNNPLRSEGKPCQIFQLLIKKPWQPISTGRITCKLIEKGKDISSESTFFTLVMEKGSLSLPFPGKLSRLHKKETTC